MHTHSGIHKLVLRAIFQWMTFLDSIKITSLARFVEIIDEKNHQPVIHFFDHEPVCFQSQQLPWAVNLVLVAGNSGMETLVENVDRSAVVLVFLSNRLKNSAACRSGIVSLITFYSSVTNSIILIYADVADYMRIIVLVAIFMVVFLRSRYYYFARRRSI